MVLEIRGPDHFINYSLCFCILYDELLIFIWFQCCVFAQRYSFHCMIFVLCLYISSTPLCCNILLNNNKFNFPLMKTQWFISSWHSILSSVFLMSLYFVDFIKYLQITSLCYWYKIVYVISQANEKFASLDKFWFIVLVRQFCHFLTFNI